MRRNFIVIFSKSICISEPCIDQVESFKVVLMARIMCLLVDSYAGVILSMIYHTQLLLYTMKMQYCNTNRFGSQSVILMRLYCIFLVKTDFLFDARCKIRHLLITYPIRQYKQSVICYFQTVTMNIFIYY
jgi:hypothetical protein